MRLIAEIIGWLDIAYGAWWLLVLALEILAVILAAKWRPFVRIGRLAIYFEAVGGIGTVTSFSTWGGERLNRLIWLFFWGQERGR